MPQVNLSQVLMHQYRDIADTDALVSEATYTDNNLPVPTNGAEAVLADGRVFKLLGTATEVEDFSDVGQSSGWPASIVVNSTAEMISGGFPATFVMPFEALANDEWEYRWTGSGISAFMFYTPSIGFLEVHFGDDAYTNYLDWLISPPPEWPFALADQGGSDFGNWSQLPTLAAGTAEVEPYQNPANWRTVVIANENDEIEGPIIVDEGTDSETLESGTLKVVGGSLVVHDGATAGGRPAAGMTPWEAASSTLSVEDNKQYVINLTSGNIDISSANMSFGGTCNLIICAAADFTLTCGGGNQYFLHDGRAWISGYYYFDSLGDRGMWFVRVDKFSIAGIEHKYFTIQGGREGL